jgi:hypothetical protein
LASCNSPSNFSRTVYVGRKKVKEAENAMTFLLYINHNWSLKITKSLITKNQIQCTII